MSFLRNDSCSPARPFFAASTLIGLIGIYSCNGASHSTSEADVDKALRMVQHGESQEAISLLRQVVAEYPGDRIGDRAALCLGNLLINRHRDAAAIPFLHQAIDGRVGAEYAEVLFVRAVAQGGLDDHRDVALKLAKRLLESEGSSPPIKEEAHFQAIELQWQEHARMETISWAEQFLSDYPDSRRSARVRWQLAESLRLLGKTRRAKEIFEDIWYRTPRSPYASEAQRYLIQLSRQKHIPLPRLSAARLVEFIESLQTAGHHEAALEYADRYLSKFPRHPSRDRVLYRKAITLHALRRNDECVATVQELWKRYPNSRWVPAAALYAIRAIRRSNDVARVRRWCYRSFNRFSNNSKGQDALFNLGIFLSNVGKIDEGLKVLGDFLARAPKHRHASDALWRIGWEQFRMGRFGDALVALERLPRDYPRSTKKRAALYWTGRTLIKLGDNERARRAYRRCLEEGPNHYYGFLALDNLLDMGDRPHDYWTREPFPKIDDLTDPGRRPDLGEGYIRSVHLKGIGLYELARLELAPSITGHDEASLQFALALLQSKAEENWAAIGIINRHFREFVFAGARDEGRVPHEFWQIVYPFHYQAAITKSISEAGLEESGIDPFLVAAIIRFESLFWPHAVSPVGAVGLMQLMPGTAGDIAKQIGIPPPTRTDLFDPELNIRYGVHYLAQKIQSFNGDWFPAICSYNAGEGPVRRWWRKKGSQPNDEFIENIPFVATRQYLKDVLGTYRNYQQLYTIPKPN